MLQLAATAVTRGCCRFWLLFRFFSRLFEILKRANKTTRIQTIDSVFCSFSQSDSFCASRPSGTRSPSEWNWLRWWVHRLHVRVRHQGSSNGNESHCKKSVEADSCIDRITSITHTKWCEDCNVTAKRKKKKQIFHAKLKWQFFSSAGLFAQRN